MQSSNGLNLVVFAMCRLFLGLANFYHCFVWNFALIAHPLTELTRKGVEFTWGGVEVATFAQLKMALTSAPVL